LHYLYISDYYAENKVPLQHSLQVHRYKKRSSDFSNTNGLCRIEPIYFLVFYLLKKYPFDHPKPQQIHGIHCISAGSSLGTSHSLTFNIANILIIFNSKITFSHKNALFYTVSLLISTEHLTKTIYTQLRPGNNKGGFLYRKPPRGEI